MLLDSTLMSRSMLSHLECPKCKQVFDYSQPRNLCTCGSPLLARYDLARAAKTLSLSSLKGRTNSMWRYEEVMPTAVPVTLGEGTTPLLRAGRLGEVLGLR